MKTTLTGDGRIDIPSEIRQADHLAAGDAFSLERLTPGHYLLTRLPSPQPPLTIMTAADGLPLIRGAGGVITAQQVQDEFMTGVREGFEQLDRGEGVPIEEVEKRMAQKNFDRMK